MVFRCYLPLGYLSDESWASAHYYNLQHRLLVDTKPFAGDHFHALYSFSPPTKDLDDPLRRIVAIWPGTQLLMFNQMVSVEMLPSQRLELGRLLGEDTPIPTRATYGPVQVNPTSMHHDYLTGGQEIGRLDGQAFSIFLQDQYGLLLSPIAVFELFEKLGLWALPAGTRCPLIHSTDLNLPVDIAGPDLVAEDQPYLLLRGGSRGTTIHNPPDPLPSSYFTFLSNDTITVGLQNRQASGGATITIKDISDPGYRSQAHKPPEVTLSLPNDRDIVIQDELKPHHLPYKRPVKNSTGEVIDPGNGKLTPGMPLIYRLQVNLTGQPSLVTTISQDTRDVIRQEYLFHSKPFQSGDTVLDIPTRAQIQRNVPPPFATHFTAGDVQKSNYGATNGNYLLNVEEVYTVAEYMRRQFAEHLAKLRDDDPSAVPDTVVSYDLNINSSWRNPERNEAVDGVQKSDHQFGRALDLKSIHREPNVKNNQRNVPLMVTLFDAGLDLLKQLIVFNGATACANVQILLEHNSQLLWSYKMRSDGTIKSKEGSKYSDVVGSSPPTDTDEAIRKAAAWSTHVHVGWKPADEATPLKMPGIGSYAPLPPTPETYRNIILIMTEDVSVPPEDQIAVNHAADSIKKYLETIDPLVKTEIHEVANAYDWLQHCNAWSLPNYKIAYFVSLSHAWPGGLRLKNFKKGTPYKRTAGSSGPQIHDAAVHEKLSALYGYRSPTDFTPGDMDMSVDTPLLPLGEDDYNTFKTHQIRVSNLRLLPEDIKDRIRRTFANARGIYAVGCRDAGEPDVKDSNFCQELATLLGKPVFGAAYFSRFFSPDDQGKWQERKIHRGDPAPQHQPLVLVPGAYGGWQLLGYIFTKGLPPRVPDFPPTSGLLEVYEHFLTRCDPKGD